MRRLLRSMTVQCWFLLMGVAVPQLFAQGVEVSAKILLRASSSTNDGKGHNSPSLENVVLWLSPLKTGTTVPPSQSRPPLYRLVQKDKMFTPHLLVVPTGTSVQFPNEDPFFHNVFSLLMESVSTSVYMNQVQAVLYASTEKVSRISSAIFIRKWEQLSSR